MSKKKEIPEFATKLAVSDVESVEEFKNKYLYRPKHGAEWHAAVLKTMLEDFENRGYAMISNHSSITRETMYFINKEWHANEQN